MIDKLFGQEAEDVAVLSRRERKKRNQKYGIIRAAQLLIEEQGYDETTINAIADAADISYATFFNYFPTKDDMLLAIDRVELEDLQEVISLRFCKEDPISTILSGVFSEWVADCLKYRNVFSRMRDVVMHSDISGLGLVTDLLAGLVEEGIRRGEFRPDANPELTAMLLAGLCSEISFTKRADLEEPGLRKILDGIMA